MAVIKAPSRAVTIFLIASAVFGTNYLWANMAVHVFSPIEVAWGRSALAAVTLLIVLFVSGGRLPRGWRVWRRLMIAALLFNTTSFTFMAFAISRVTTVQAGVVNTVTPLLTLALVALFVPAEPITRRRLIGVLLGLVGVLVLVQPFGDWGPTDLVGIASMFGAVATYAAGIVYARVKLGDVTGSTVAIAAGQLLCATVQLSFFLPFGGGWPSPITANSIIGILVLGIVGTGLGYILQHALIRTGGASMAGDATYLVLLVAVTTGVLILGEPFTLRDGIGAAIILSGLVIATRGRVNTPLRPAPP